MVETLLAEIILGQLVLSVLTGSGRVISNEFGLLIVYLYFVMVNNV